MRTHIFNIYLDDHAAFVILDDNSLLCIGTKEEVLKANADRIAEMMVEALGFYKFRSIEHSTTMTLH